MGLLFLMGLWSRSGDGVGLRLFSAKSSLSFRAASGPLQMVEGAYEIRADSPAG